MGKILTVALLVAVLVIIFAVKGAVLGILREVFGPPKKGR
jgi:hypothetical protein